MIKNCLLYTSDTLNEAYSAYVKQLASGQIIDAGDLAEVTGRVLQVDSAVKDGNTYFYVQISGSDKVFMASIQSVSYTHLIPYICKVN